MFYDEEAAVKHVVDRVIEFCFLVPGKMEQVLLGRLFAVSQPPREVSGRHTGNLHEFAPGTQHLQLVSVLWLNEPVRAPRSTHLA